MPQSGFSFASLASTFREIESTSGRRVMTALLADLFRANPSDSAILPYLLQGRLGPPFDAPNLGLDEKRLAEAIATVADRRPAEIQESYLRLGDLGLVATEFLHDTGSDVTVREVYEDLRTIAGIGGSGSAVGKLGAFERLLRRVGGEAAWGLIRVASGTLRLGVGDATILDALSLACSGSLALRPALERAYSLTSDLGYVAATLFQQGIGGLADVHPTPGRPVLAALAERLPSSDEIIRQLGPVIAEPKYDGLRLQAQKSGERAWLFTRRLEDVTAAFSEVERAVRRQVKASEAILDGEVIGFDPVTDRLLPLQQTVRRRRKHNVETFETTVPLRYFAFDLLSVNGRDLTREPFRERARLLHETVETEPGRVIVTTPQTLVTGPAELDQFLAAMLEAGMEGAVVKRPDSTYHAGSRQLNWVKLKREYERQLADTVDLVIVGFDRGKGRRARLGIGSLLGAVYDPETDRFRTVSRVATGLSEDAWVQLRELLDAIRRPEPAPNVDALIRVDEWVEPRYVMEVIAAGISRSPMHTSGKKAGEPGYALRFPRISQLRPDRRPEDSTTEAEIEAMYRRTAS